MEITKKDINKIKKLAKDPHIYDKLFRSIAPSIRGYRDIKEAIILSLFMGNDKQLDDKLFPGGIKILIIGDHNTGKSTILNDVEKYGIRDKFRCIDNITSDDESSLRQLLTENKSIICAGNFVNGNVDRFSSIVSQLGFSNDFLDCFDLVFLIKDTSSKNEDSSLADYILDIHKTAKVPRSIPYDLFKKYVVYSYVACKPELTDGAIEVLKEFYVCTRKGNSEDKAPFKITPKHLESMIRLSEASAKIKLKKTVDKEDAERAVKLQMACLKEIGVDPETGEIDEDIVNASRSEREIIQSVIDEVERLEVKYNDYVPIEVLNSVMLDEYGVEEFKVKNIVLTLIQYGVVYQPDKGYIRRVV